MVLRDRCHPSVFCWSIGNEVIERKQLAVVKTAHQMAALCRELDEEHRPVTSALASWDSDWDIYDPLAAEHDIVGYNYMIHMAESDHQRVPNRVMMQTESYPRDAWDNYAKVRDNDYIVGDFVWTAIDYQGESGIGRWYYEGDTPGEHYQRPLFPWHAAYCGDIDLTGLRKPVSHYRDMLWNASDTALFMAVREPDGYHGRIKTTKWGTWPTFESWNWPGHEGKPIEVEVYTRCSVVRLYLNDRLIEQKKNAEENQLKLTFTLPYQPGTLRAAGFSADGSSPVATATLQTAGEPTAIRLTADRTTLQADGQDLSFITVQLTDAYGVPCPTAAQPLHASVTGAAELLAFGNADIKDTDALTDADHKTWNGRALLVVRSKRKGGTAKVTVSSAHMKPATLKLQSK